MIEKQIGGRVWGVGDRKKKTEDRRQKTEGRGRRTKGISNIEGGGSFDPSSSLRAGRGFCCGLTSAKRCRRPQLVRHFTKLSAGRLSYGVQAGPLGASSGQVTGVFDIDEG